MEFYIEYDTTITPPEKYAEQTSLKLSYAYNIIYESAMYCIFVFLGPLLILIFLNTCLMIELIAARERLKKRQLPQSNEEDDNNMTLVMIIIILLFVVFQTPAFINQLLNILSPESYACGKPYYYYFHISNLLISSNSATNFGVYCVFRAQFRERLHNFCNRKRLSMSHSNSVRSQNGRTLSVYSRANTCDTGEPLW